MRVLVTSQKDPASQTIKNVLIQEHGFRSTQEIFEGSVVYSHGPDVLLITSAQDMIFCEHLEQHFDAEVFIFCSRHRAQSGMPALLVHSTGNFGEDTSYGGQPRALAVSAPSLVSVALRTLHLERDRRNLTQFDVTMEVTHHGPTGMKTPLLFVELGSDETYWVHEEGARVVAEAVMECVSTKMGSASAIGFGGTHYARKFNGLVLGEEYRIGHVAPKYALDHIEPQVVQQMASRSADPVSIALVDWKGTNASQRERILPALRDLGLEVVKAR